MDTTLIIMAAGIGSRFGEGIKQLAKMGPNGEIIMDYWLNTGRKILEHWQHLQRQNRGSPLLFRILHGMISMGG